MYNINNLLVSSPEIARHLHINSWLCPNASRPSSAHWRAAGGVSLDEMRGEKGKRCEASPENDPVGRVNANRCGRGRNLAVTPSRGGLDRALRKAGVGRLSHEPCPVHGEWGQNGLLSLGYRTLLLQVRQDGNWLSRSEVGPGKAT